MRLAEKLDWEGLMEKYGLMVFDIKVALYRPSYPVVS
jgi:hypothetical protein